MENIAGLWTIGDLEGALGAASAVDATIAAGLRALGFERGPVTVRLAAQSGAEHGAKTHTCDLIVAVRYLISMLRPGGKADSVFRTWVHESVHARAPFPASFYEDEWRQWKGYEEGLAEGLARLITRDKARMDPLSFAYDGYVRAYRSLARSLGVSVELLWTLLYAHRNGRVRAALPEVVRRIRFEQGTAEPDPRRLLSTADRVFHSAEAESSVRSSEIDEGWRWALL